MIRTSLSVLALAFAVGCNSDPADTDTDADTDTSPVNEIPNDWGFIMRLPREVTVDCEGTPQAFPEKDQLCTFDYDGAVGVVYLQATPTSCVRVMDYLPTYGSTGEINVGQGAEPLASVVYDWGGNHQNDSVEFDHGSEHYRYYHSSFGFGWRKCHDLDCMQVSASGGGAVIEDGCTCDRTLPITCSPIQADGTWAELVDTFEVCNGDSTCAP